MYEISMSVPYGKAIVEVTAKADSPEAAQSAMDACAQCFRSLVWGEEG